MNDNPRANGSRGRDPYAALRLIALIAAIAGVVVLAAAAFVLSYGGIHKIALSAGVSPSVARIFPVIFDAMLVVSCAAVVSLRSAGWWQRTYSWLSTLALLVVVAAADAAHATGTHIPRKPAAAIVAVLPWALLLLAFSLLLSMLRQFRRTRTAAADAPVTDRAAAETAPAGTPGLDILSARSPAQHPAAAGTTTQPNTMRPAGMAADSVPPRETVAVSVPARDSETRRTDPDPQPQRNPSQPAPLPGPQQAGRPEPPAERGEAPIGVASAESGLNGAAPARSADREPPGQDRADQEPVGEEQAVQEQVALEVAGEDQASGDGQAEPAPEPRAQPADAQPADPQPAEAESDDAPSPDPESHTDQPDTEPSGADQPDTEQPGGTEPTGPEPAGAGGGTIHVPHQAMPAPVPAPSPHFDRLRSTPTPPEDEPDSDS